MDEFNHMNKEQLNVRLVEINNKIKENDNIIKIEQNKMNKYREENERRQHNYIPFIFELLKIMGEKGVLEETYKEALEEENKKNQQVKK